ncbi:MAG: WbqC family protein, partial [Rhizobiales bacterium]|nr:WbqC family protein [Hyphomicrobiales bacterium]
HNADRVAARQRIDATRVADPNWSRQHLELFHHCYRRAAAFEPVIAWLQPLFRALADEPLLSVINLGLLKAIAGRLDLATPIRRTSDYLADAEIEDLDRTERIIRLCRAAGADRYLSGPAARTYLDEAAMAKAGIAVAWMDYSGYPPYPQPWGAFAPNVSIVDLLFCTGDEAGRYIGRGGD